MRFSFQKWQALGNDFIITESLPSLELIQNIPFFCHRRFGIGADGFIFLNTSIETPSMEFFNQDGTKVAMCGNGLRSVMHYLIKMQKEPKVNFHGNVHTGFFEKQKLYVSMPSPGLLECSMAPYQGVWVNAGVPHFLIEEKALEKKVISSDVFSNRYHKAFGKEGTNITFYEKNQDHILLRTAERGVDEETLSCGSAACALSLLFEENELTFIYKSQSKAYVKKIGETLYLAGDAKFVFSGQFGD